MLCLQGVHFYFLTPLCIRFVYLKNILSCKCLVTVCTVVWFDTSMYTFRVSFRWLCCVNALLHCVHLYGLTPLCIRSCVLRISSRVNALLQCVQLYGLTPLCIRSCAFRWPCLCKMPCLQCVHLYGLTPLCIRSCTLRRSSRVNALLQCVQLYGLTPLCIRSCVLRTSSRVNALSTVCTLIWF